jgi:GNAT superfamily N-acetyltransferase
MHSQRPATAGDRAFVEEVYFATQRYIIEALFGWRGADVEAAKFASIYDQPNTVIITEGTEDIGWMAVVRRKDEIVLQDLYIVESKQEQGIGAAILCDLIAEASHARVPLRLATAKMNRARSLYERLGFRIIGEDEYKFFMEYKLATPEDADALG